MQFEALYKELVDSTEMIRALLSGVSQEDAQIKPDSDSWSILEVVCHLHDVEREDFREHLDFILHRQDEDWHVIDPQSWVAGRKYNKQDLETMKTKFFEERKRSIAWLREHDQMEPEIKYSSDGGEMTAGETFASWIAHDNLHCRQLVELRRRRIERITHPYPIEYAGDW